jgi:hypothetical protein
MTESTHQALTEAELEAAVSAVSMIGYRRASSQDKAKILAWVPLLQEMPDEEFVMECAGRILDSAIMNGYRGNAWSTHARADICADEASRRHQAAGHSPDCRGATLYSQGYSVAMKNQGHSPQPPAPCTCGREEK